LINSERGILVQSKGWNSLRLVQMVGTISSLLYIYILRAKQQFNVIEKFCWRISETVCRKHF